MESILGYFILFYRPSINVPLHRESTFGSSVDIINTDQKTYYYSMDWRDKIVDSSLFYIRSGHENPKEFPIRNRIQIANNVMMGTFKLSDAVKTEISNFIDITSDTRPEDPSIKLHSGLYYHCNDVFNPEIGDIRLKFQTAGVEGSFVRTSSLTFSAHDIISFRLIDILLASLSALVHNRCKI